MGIDETSGTAASIGREDMIEALVQAMFVWDEESHRHSVETADYAAAIAREMGLSAEQQADIRAGAMLHDIGKMGVDLQVLKKPGQLDEHDLEHVQLHPLMGASILRRVLPASIVECAEAHHEQPDGGGYPKGLREPDIPLTALICRVADVFDSLTTDQTYRPAMTVAEATAELEAGAGTRYGAEPVRALLALVGRSELPAAA